VDRGRVFFEQPVEEPKPLLERKVGARDKRRQYGHRVVRRDHQAFLSSVSERLHSRMSRPPDI
jgi:hypothetical protein